MDEPQPQVPPAPPLSYAPPTNYDDTGKIARAQRHLTFSFLAFLAALILSSIAHLTHDSFLRSATDYAIIATILLTVATNFRLALLVYSQSTAIIYTLGLLIPIVNLFLVLAINGQATQLLRRRGLKVGLMGVRPADLASRARIMTRTLNPFLGE